MSVLDVQNLSVRFGSLTIVDNISFKLGDGEWLMIVGPNGAGKSTVVSAVSQGLQYEGSVCYGGANLRKMNAAKLARHIGVLSQTQSVTYSFTVGEIVRLGRYSYAPGIFQSRGDEDTEYEKNALELTGMSALADQSVLTLSGGELQRTFLAQVFAQNPELLILDEPTNHLDLVYQKQVFAIIRNWLKQEGRSVISVVHDLSLARAYGTHIMLMNKGKIVSHGTADKVLTRENLQSVYDMDVHAWMREMLAQWE